MGLSRRQFLAGGLAAVAGCSRLDRAARSQIQAELRARAAFLDALAPVGGPFTTPTPPVNLLETAPKLKGLVKLAHRLHPTPASFDALQPTESHFGGPLDWPAEVPFPADARGKLLVPVLQLRAADAPGQVRFRPGSDLLHLFWDARVGAEPRAMRLVWGKSGAGPTPHALAGLGARPADPAWLAQGLSPAWVPVPARLNPERLLEFPSLDILPKRMQDELFPELPGGEAQYRDALSVAPGSKAGGYAPRQPNGLPPACATCRWGTDYLFTVAAAEYPATPGSRWEPTPAGPRNPLDVGLGAGGMVNVFCCRRCEEWPGGFGVG